MDISPELIEKFRNGDSIAFRELYNSNFLRLFNFAKKYIECKEDIEDIVSETFIKLWNLRTNFNTSHSIYAFLFNTVKNASIDYLRKQKVEAKRNNDLQYVLSIEADQENDFNSTLSAIKEEVMKQVYDEIEALPEQCKKIFKMAYLDGLTGQEIASRLNINHQTVRNQLSRGLKILRKNISLNAFERNITIVILYWYAFWFN